MNRTLKARIVEIFGTQTEFARQVQESETIVSRVIRGHSALPDGKKKVWARVLDTNVNDLFNKR